MTVGLRPWVVSAYLNATATTEIHFLSLHDALPILPITVSGQTGGANTQTFNEQINGSQWVPHGTYSFAAGESGRAHVGTAVTSRAGVPARCCKNQCTWPAPGDGSLTPTLRTGSGMP